MKGAPGLLALLVLGMPRLEAQRPSPTSVHAFRDSLRAVAEIRAATELVAREHRGTVTEKSLRRLRYGWALIRLGELSDRPDPLIRAAEEFYEAAGRAPRPAEAWFGVGSAKGVLDAIGAREFRSQHQTAGTGWRQGAIIAYLEAIRLDPDEREAAIEAAKLTLRDDRVVLRPGLGDALLRAVREDSLDPLGWMLLGRLYRRQGLDTAATDAYAQAVRLGGSGLGVASLEFSRELMWIGRPDSGSRVYYRGAGMPDSDAVGAYRRDIAMIAPDSVVAEWDRLSPALRPGWLHEFWRSREVASGRPAGTRLPEHERRWRIASRRYPLAQAWVHQYEFGMPYRSGSDDIDDRGIIYIRHGDPDERINHPALYGEDPSESWVYVRPERNRVFTFVQTTRTSGWRLFANDTLINNSNVIPDLIGWDPVYMSLYMARQRNDRSDRISVQIARDIQMNREAIGWGTSTDSDPLHFERRLHPIVQAFGIGGDREGDGRVLLLWAVPQADLPPPDTVPGVDGVVYRLRTRVNLTDHGGHLVLGSDTLRRFRAPAPIPEGRFLVGTTIYDLVAGSYDLQLTLADSAEAAGALRVVRAIPVPAFAGEVEMSDLVLGLEGEQTWWDAAGGRFPLNPRNAWRQGETVEVGFEFAGLPPGASFEVRTMIADLGADSTRPPRASIAFSRTAPGRRELVRQGIALQGLPPGLYLLTTQVRVGERVLQRERRITIVAR